MKLPTPDALYNGMNALALLGIGAFVTRWNDKRKDSAAAALTAKQKDSDLEGHKLDAQTSRYEDLLKGMQTQIDSLQKELVTQKQASATESAEQKQAIKELNTAFDEERRTRRSLEDEVGTNQREIANLRQELTVLNFNHGMERRRLEEDITTQAEEIRVLHENEDKSNLREASLKSRIAELECENKQLKEYIENIENPQIGAKDKT